MAHARISGKTDSVQLQSKQKPLLQDDTTKPRDLYAMTESIIAPIGRLQLRTDGGYWHTSNLLLDVLGRLNTRVSHVVVDDIGAKIDTSSRGELEDVFDYSDLLMQKIYKVLDLQGGSVEVRGSRYDYVWDASNKYQAEFTDPIFIDGSAYYHFDSDNDGDSDDDEFVPERLDASILAMTVTDQDELLRYPAAARVIQRALRRHVDLVRAARIVQRAWRLVSGNPYGKLGERLLRKRFLPPIETKRRRLV
jgi:hypothetical protein